MGFLKNNYMPIGSFSVVPHIVKGLLSTAPTSVLDLGIGFGMNGCVVRNWLDHGMAPYNTILVGVEVFPEYQSPAWDMYDTVAITDIESYLNQCITNGRKFDMVIMTDVIEHFTKEDGTRVLKLCKEVCNKAVMVSTPAIFIEQGAYAGNEHEKHLSHWTIEDFAALGFGIVKDGRPDNFGHQMLVVDYIKK